MVTYVVLVNFTDQGIRTVKDTVKRAGAFTDVAKKFGVTTKEFSGRKGDMISLLSSRRRMNLLPWRPV